MIEPATRANPAAPWYDDRRAAIVQGDCLDILPGVGTGTIDIVVTDPPYMVAYRGNGNRYEAMAHDGGDGWWVEPVFAELFRVLRADSFCVSFYGWPHVDLWMRAWKAVGFRPVSHLLFEKEYLGLGHVTRSKHETAFVLAKGRPRVVRAIPDLLPFRREDANPHPTPKPVAPLAQVIAALVPEESLVLDPFAGSGSTLIAAKAVGCRSVGIEIEPRWCELAARRLSQAVLSFPPQVDAGDQLTLFPCLGPATDGET